MIPKGCPGHKTGRIPALLPVSIFCFSIIGAKLKAEKHALWAALRSAACGGALRRCAAPSAAARRFAPPLRGATRPARCARSPFANTKKNKCLTGTPDTGRGSRSAYGMRISSPYRVRLLVKHFIHVHNILYTRGWSRSEALSPLVFIAKVNLVQARGEGFSHPAHSGPAGGSAWGRPMRAPGVMRR